jgi:threonine dehydratase
MQPTIADGISVALPGTLNFEIIKKTVDDFVTVSDDDIARALVVLLERAKLVVEPAGAVGIAAIMAGKIKKSAGTTVAILSGGNIDPKVMEKVLSHGLVASGRYMRIRIPLPDRPGQLARIAEIVAGLNANVVEVLHTRHGTGLQITQVELDVDIETRGHEHAAQVLEALRAEGYDPKVGY